MENMRPLISLAELATRSLRPSSSLASIASRNYHYSCQSSKMALSHQKPFHMTQSNTILAARRTYSTTSFMLSASPFRLTSQPKQPENKHPAEEDPENVDAEEDGGYYNPYKPKRQWPPDMSKLSPKHQLRLERKYRRRAALKYARPRWVKATKLVQWGVIIFVVVYSVLFMEWGKEGEEHPFEDFRKDLFASFDSLFAAPQPPSRKKE